MGVLSDLVVAPVGDADRVAHAQVPSQVFDGIDIKGIDSVKFGILHSLLTGRAFGDLLPLYDPAVTVSEEGPWVFQIPQDLVASLAGLDEPRKSEVARQWAKTAEFALDRWAEGEVASALDSISTLAKRGVEPGQALFLWMSL
jgi:hypothetical protein